MHLCASLCIHKHIVCCMHANHSQMVCTKILTTSCNRQLSSTLSPRLVRFLPRLALGASTCVRARKVYSAIKMQVNRDGCTPLNFAEVMRPERERERERKKTPTFVLKSFFRTFFFSFEYSVFAVDNF